MEMFYITSKQMLLMFFLMLLGYILRKKSVIPENSNTVMAKLENYIFVPALSLYTQLTKCTMRTFTENSTLILYGFGLTLGSLILSIPISKLFIKRENSAEDSYQRNIYKYAMTFGNFGFMGNFIILEVWGNDLYYKYTLFTFLIGVICNSWGLYILVPKDKGLGMIENIKRGIIKPPLLALITGMLLGLSGIARYVPEFMINTFETAGRCQGPIAMLLAGFVIGGYDLKELLLNKKVYIASLFRLILIPAFISLILKASGCSVDVMTLALIAFATPLGLNTIVYPAAYGGDTKTGASMAMVSHTLSVITIPLMYFVFIVLF